MERHWFDSKTSVFESKVRRNRLAARKEKTNCERPVPQKFSENIPAAGAAEESLPPAQQPRAKGSRCSGGSAPGSAPGHAALWRGSRSILYRRARCCESETLSVWLNSVCDENDPIGFELADVAGSIAQLPQNLGRMFTVKGWHVSPGILRSFVESSCGPCLPVLARGGVLELENGLIVAELFIVEELVEIQYRPGGNVFGNQPGEKVLGLLLAHGVGDHPSKRGDVLWILSRFR